MKIGVVGDIHIGASYTLGKTDPQTQLNSRLIDFSNTFNGIIDNFISRQVRLVVLTGDVFESRKPSPEQINVLCKCLNRAVQAGLEIVIVVGNHDQQRNINTTAVDFYKYLNIPKITIFSELGVKTIKDEDKIVNLVLLPYRDKRMIGSNTNSEAINVIKQNLSDLAKNYSGFKMLVGHFMLEKTEEEENPDSLSINELILPLGTFKNFDVILMGHIHKHGIVSATKPVIIYTGSMEKVSFGEKDHTKISVVIDTDNADNFEIIKTGGIRNLYELNFDYSDKEYKETINNKIIEDVQKFNNDTPLKDSIIKFVAKVKDVDLNHVNQQKIKEFLLNQEPFNLVSMQISSIVHRQLRNSNITETLDSKKAFSEFIKNLPDSDKIKKKLQKYSEQIMDDIKGK